MPFNESRARHLMALLPLVAGVLFLWVRRRRRSSSAEKPTSETASAEMASIELESQKSSDVKSGVEAIGVDATTAAPVFLEKKAGDEHAVPPLVVGDPGDLEEDEDRPPPFEDDVAGENNDDDDGSFVDFTKQRVIDWAEEQVFIDEEDLELDLRELLVGDRGADALSSMHRCSTLVSYSEIDSVSQSGGQSTTTTTTKESAYSSLHTTPKGGKGKSPRNRKLKRRCYSGGCGGTNDGSGSSNNNNDAAARSFETYYKASSSDRLPIGDDNWRLHMEQYHVDDDDDVNIIAKAVSITPGFGSPSNNDISSVISYDSGHGGGGGLEAATATEVVYEFEFPSELCGRLIGKGGRNLQQLMDESGTQMMLRKQPFQEDKQIVTVIGRYQDVHRLLRLVRERFPKHRHPNVDLRPVAVPLPPGIVVPDMLALRLVEGASNHVLVSAIVSPTHIFLQLPVDETFADLRRLDTCMLACYCQVISPVLPQPVELGVLCAAPHERGWYRAQVVQLLPDAAAPSPPTVDDLLIANVRFVDYGGYATMPVANLRQIRSDFLSLPFQAVECYLAGLEAVGVTADDNLRGSWCLDRLVRDKNVRAEVVAYDAEGTPFVNVYATIIVNDDYNNDVDNCVCVNVALVEEGVCRSALEEEVPMKEEVVNLADENAVVEDDECLALLDSLPTRLEEVVT